MTKKEEFGSDYAANQIARQRNPLRKLIKSFYVSRVVRHVDGPTIDLGCGAGQILERLPPGSVGIEVNPYLVTYLAERGFRVLPAVASEDGFDLNQIKKNEFKSLVLSHVLEHFDNANLVLGALLRNCSKLGLETVIIVVPGANGYRSDATHKTFVTMDYLHQYSMIDYEDFHLVEHSYFPFNFKFIGELFVYHELMLVYKNKNSKMDGSKRMPYKYNIKHAFRFIFIGILNTGFSYLIYAMMLFIGLEYRLANLIAMLTGILFSFKTQGHFVFFNTDNKLLGKFVISWITIYLGNITFIGWLMSYGFDAYWAGAMALPFSVVLSYLTQRYFVFR